MPDRHRKPSAQREAAAVHADRDARRPDDYVDQAIEGMKAIRDKKRRGGLGQQALEEAVEVLRATMWEAATDPGPPPEVRRNQVSQIAQMLAKAADPQKQLEELGRVVREQHADIAELEARVRADASYQPSGDSGSAYPAADH
jgi:hypothetical protein